MDNYLQLASLMHDSTLVNSHFLPFICLLHDLRTSFVEMLAMRLLKPLDLGGSSCFFSDPPSALDSKLFPYVMVN